MQFLYEKLGPWDENSLFETPTAKFITIGIAAANAVIVSANPRRIAFIVGTGSAPGWIAPGQTLAAAASINTQQGFNIGTPNSPFVFHHDQFGPLVAMDWAGANPTGQAQPCVMTVVELLLRTMPERNRDHETVQNIIRQRTKPSRFSPDYRAKLKQVWDQVLSSARRAGYAEQ